MESKIPNFEEVAAEALDLRLGYDANALLQYLAAQGIEVVIPPMKHRPD